MVRVYIGKPPPSLRIRQEEEREWSPAVPDPEPVTPSRADVFTTPTHSSRVYKTYARKRRRSFASSGAEEPGHDDDVPSSRESSPDRSPTRIPRNVTTARPEPGGTNEQSGNYHEELEPGPSTLITTSPVRTHRRRRSSVYVEIPPPPKRLRIRGDFDATPDISVALPSAGSSRGRASDTRSTAIPAPPTTRHETALSSRRRQEDSSGALALAEVMNKAFASAARLSLSPTADAAPSGSQSVPPKRGRGRPPGRGRGSALARSFQPHATLDSSPLARTRTANSSPIRAPRVASSSRSRHAPEQENEAVEVPIKRPRGRPRKNPIPQLAEDLPVASRSLSRGRSRQRRGSVEVQEVPSSAVADVLPTPKRGPGRPRKYPLPETPNVHRQASRSRSRAGRPSLPLLQPTASQVASSVDIGPVAQTLQRQAAREASYPEIAVLPTETPKRRGRPPGSKNKATLEREAQKQRLDDSAFSANPIVMPQPVKRRPRKSAPAGTSMEETLDYMEPLKDADEAGPSTLRRGRSRSRSRTRRNSIAAMPSAAAPEAEPALKTPSVAASSSSSWYLDFETLKWKQRTPQPASSSIPPRKSQGPEEYQTSQALCASLKKALIKVPPTISRGDVQEGEEHVGKNVFQGSWAVLADPAMEVDDALAMKVLHEIVVGLGACLNLDNSGPQFAQSEDGLTIAVAVPCGCLSIPEVVRAHLGQAEVGSPPPECPGEMAITVCEDETPEGFADKAKALRMSVTVTH